MSAYITTRDITIPAGTKLFPPPTSSTRWGKDHDAPIAIDADHTGYFSIDIAGAIEAGFVEPVTPTLNNKDQA